MKPEPIIERLIKAYEELIDLKYKESIGDAEETDHLRMIELRNQITALIKDYRERRKFVNVYEIDGERFLSNNDWDSYGDAYDWRDKLDTYKETVEIIRNKP